VESWKAIDNKKEETEEEDAKRESRDHNIVVCNGPHRSTKRTVREDGRSGGRQLERGRRRETLSRRTKCRQFPESHIAKTNSSIGYARPRTAFTEIFRSM